MTLGPMQVLVVGFRSGAEFHGEIAAELEQLREHDVVRLVELIFVHKDDDGTVTSRELSELPAEESAELGVLAGSLVGFAAADGQDGAFALEQEVRQIADAIPPGTSAALAVLEHLWAVPLRQAIERNHGAIVADAWLASSARAV
jgi:hypothetical protein